MIGTTLSHYRVVEELGKGGMGVVYRAEDTKLDRTVALKLLAPHMLASKSDRNRFHREARSAAALHHPNIATVFEIDELEDGRPFIAMEFIEGQSLEALIEEGPIHLDRAMSIGLQIAEALNAAHAKNIVHRDIKSANVMMTADGRAKVLDFGLAKTQASTKLTQMGDTLGTVAYMSPEQTRGEEVDHRTDVWSLGAVLYEMISGKLPFAGDYEQAVVYSILNGEPQPLTAIRTGVPMELEQVVAKCLRKDPDLRYPSAAGVIADLRAIGLGGTSSGSMNRTTVSSVGRADDHGTAASATVAVSEERSVPAGPGKRKLAVVAAAVGGIALGGIGVALSLTGLTGLASDPGVAKEVVRSTIALPPDLPIVLTESTYGVDLPALDVSGDGSRLVYVASRNGENVLALRDLATGSTQTLAETEGAFSPTFSQDDDWIAYAKTGGIYRVPADGGRPRFVVEGSDPIGVAWLEDEFIYWVEVSGYILYRSDVDGNHEDVSGPDCGCGLPAAGPGGLGVVVSGRDQEVVKWFRDGHDPIVTGIRGFNTRYGSDGVLYTRDGTLHMSRYDADTGAPVGDEAQILDDIRTGSIVRAAHYAVTRGGTMVYVAGEPSGRVDIVTREPDGTERPVGLPAGAYGPVDVHADGRQILIHSYDRGGQILLYDLDGEGERAMPPANSAMFRPGSNSVVYSTDEPSIASVRLLDLSSGQDAPVFTAESGAGLEGVSPDGRFVAYRKSLAGGLYYRELSGGDESLLARVEDAVAWGADWSRDGQFFAYTVEGSGGATVYASPFPPDGRKWMVSQFGRGEEGEWLPDRDAIVYRLGDTWYEVAYRVSGGELEFSEPEALFTGPYINVAGMEYRMMDGGRALLQRPLNTDRTASSLQVISGFDHVIERLLAD